MVCLDANVCEDNRQNQNVSKSDDDDDDTGGKKIHEPAI